MNVLVYGAGPLGSLFAARLLEAGQDVSLLARGQRLADLHAHGLVLVDAQTKQESVFHPRIVERLDPEDAYGLVLVIMRKNRVQEILPCLAANRHTPNLLFLMNNAAGPGELVSALGASRVLLGFPSAAGYRRGHKVFTFMDEKGRDAAIPIGEVDGRITSRLQDVGQVLSSMSGFTVELRTDMDAWLKTHVALLMPSLAPAIRAAGRDHMRFVRTRDCLVLAARAIREGFCVLQALGCPIVPARLRVLGRLPEPVLVFLLRKFLSDSRLWTAMMSHGEAAQDEIKHLAGEFMLLKSRTSVRTPAIDQLQIYFDPAAHLMPDGSARIPMDWRFAWVLAAGIAILLGIILVLDLII